MFGPKIPSGGNALAPSGKTRIGDGSIVFTRSPLKVAPNDMLLVASRPFIFKISKNIKAEHTLFHPSAAWPSSFQEPAIFRSPKWFNAG